MWLSSIYASLGEICKAHHEIPEFKNKLDELNMPDNQSFWGWGEYYTTRGNVFSLAESSIKQCLSKSRATNKIDYIFICSSNFENSFNDNTEKLNAMLFNVGISNIPVVGVTLTGCINIMTALVMAEGLLNSNVAKNILIVSADRLSDERLRLSQFCLFSDAAIAFILSKEIKSGIRLIETKTGVTTQTPNNNHSVLKHDTESIRSNLDGFLKKNSLSIDNIDLFIVPNFYPPILRVFLNSVGIPWRRCYKGYGANTSHFFSCDQFISINEYIQGEVRSGENIVIFGYAKGFYSFSLLNTI